MFSLVIAAILPAFKDYANLFYLFLASNAVSRHLRFVTAEIESNVAIPGRGRYKPLLLKMLPGQSVFLRDKNIQIAAAWNHHVTKMHPNRRFTARTVKGGVRIWRIK